MRRPPKARIGTASRRARCLRSEELAREDRPGLRLEDEGDAKITEMLRDFYAAPAEGAYWDGLEARTMSYIRAHREAVIPVNWWSDLASWAAPGLAAAALLFI